MPAKFLKNHYLFDLYGIRTRKSLEHFSFILVIVIFVILTVMITYARESHQTDGNAEEAALEITDKPISQVWNDLPSYSVGDSIFHETMVDMTWLEVEKAAKEGAIILMTTAVVEEHGPHMSCGVDAYLGYLFCKLVRQELESRGIQTLIAPPLYWRINRTTHVFPGTSSLRKETMMALMHDIFASLKSWGFTDVFNINAHMDGLHVLTGLEAIRDAGQTLGMNARYAMADDFLRRFRLKGNEDFVLAYKAPPVDLGSQEYLDLHAGGFETGIVAAFFPDQIDEELARTVEPTKVTMKDLARWATDARSVTPLGYLGDPSSFNAEEAREFVKAECKGIADAIERSLANKK